MFLTKNNIWSKKVLEKPIAKVLDEFKQQNTDIKISESKISKLRPANVNTTVQKKL